MSTLLRKSVCWSCLLPPDEELFTSTALHHTTQTLGMCNTGMMNHSPARWLRTFSSHPIFVPCDSSRRKNGLRENSATLDVSFHLHLHPLDAICTFIHWIRWKRASDKRSLPTHPRPSIPPGAPVGQRAGRCHHLQGGCAQAAAAHAHRPHTLPGPAPAADGGLHDLTARTPPGHGDGAARAGGATAGNEGCRLAGEDVSRFDNRTTFRRPWPPSSSACPGCGCGRTPAPR